MLPYRKRGSGGGFDQRFAQFLQSAVHGPEIIRRMASRPRPVTFEPLPAKIKVQNGDTHFDQGCNPTRRLGMLKQPKGCLLPHSNSSGLSEVPQVQLEGQSVPICLPSLWFSPFTLRLHQGGEGGSYHPQTAGYQDPLLPRRLADPSLGQPGLQGAHVSGLFTEGFSWFCYQPGEEQSATDPVI